MLLPGGYRGLAGGRRLLRPMAVTLETLCQRPSHIAGFVALPRNSLLLIHPQCLIYETFRPHHYFRFPINLSVT